jgi:hypothetical protein
MSKVRLLGMGVISLLALYGINYVFTPDIVGAARLEVYCRPRTKLPFDAARWKRSTSNSGARYPMIDNLLDSKAILEASANDVERILGKPDLKEEREGETLFFYILGSQRTHPAKSIWFPGLFPNEDLWMLKICFRVGRPQSVEVCFR